MAFTADQLLLTASRKAEITAALANSGVADPVGSCVTEAIAEVARFTSGYVWTDDALAGFIRPLALFKLYSLIGPAPKDLAKAYTDTMTELVAISKGERPNLVLDSNPETPTGGGSWGAQTNILSRTTIP